MSCVLQGGKKLDWSLSPMEVMRRWPADRRLMMLSSGRYHPRWARYSVLAHPAGDYRLMRDTQDTLQSTWQGPTDLIDPAEFTHHASHDLRHLLASGSGLWLGYLGYELGQVFEPQSRKHAGPVAQDDRHWPLVDLSCCPGWLVHDAATGFWTTHGRWLEDWWQDLPRLPVQEGRYQTSDLSSSFQRPAYEKAVTKVIDFIAAGDIFQANLTQRFTAKLKGAYPLAQRAVFDRLNAVSPAWYGAYLETSPLPDEPNNPGRVIASTSPELFLEMDDRGQVVTRPIKGTRPASTNPAELIASEKDAAELNMIVDLLRNDLGRVCDYSSVRVTQPRTIESHPTVHHGVATIEGRLHPSRDVVDLIKAAMPGGSITGAPKIRAMQIIDELEPTTRGPYCGCIGYLSRDYACLNIAIRTLLIDPAQERVDFSVGGGIVADSQPAAEYDETIAKAQAMLQALGLSAPAPATPSATSSS